MGQSETPNHVRDEGSFPPKRSPGAGDACTADHCQPRLLLVAELDPIADAGAGEPGICNGPRLCEKSARYICTLNFEGWGHAESKKPLKFVLRTALQPNQIEFLHSLSHKRTHALQPRHFNRIMSSRVWQRAAEPSWRSAGPDRVCLVAPRDRRASLFRTFGDPISLTACTAIEQILRRRGTRHKIYFEVIDQNQCGLR